MTRRHLRNAGLFAIIAGIAILLGWWRHHVSLETKRASLQEKLNHETEAADFDRMAFLEQLQRPEVIGMAVGKFPAIQRCADRALDGQRDQGLWGRCWDLAWHNYAKPRGAEERRVYCFQLHPTKAEEGALWAFLVVTVDDKIVAVRTLDYIW